MAKKRVVITGMGAMTPLGNTVRETWSGLCAGRSGVGPITLFDAGTFPTRIAGEVKNFDFRKWENKRKGFESLGRNSHFALEAAAEAFAEAGFKMADVDPVRFGIYFGAGDGGFNLTEYAPIVYFATDPETLSVRVKDYFDRRVAGTNAKAMLEEEPFQVINHLADQFGARGVIYNTLTACAASSQAIGEAAEVIRAGRADIMMTGGSHSMIHPLGLAGFNLLTAISSTRNSEPERASRPFDKGRDGFVLSEGAGVLILEEIEHARKRNAKIYAELTGYGATADAFRLTDPHPEGRGAIAAMRMALQDAGIQPETVGYINAHGTSTQLNDQIETTSIKAVFGDLAKKIPVSSIKSMLGHMIAAAGVTELIASVLTIREGIIPPTINYETPDETCDLDYVPNKAREQKVKTVLSNSFGFGGQNIALVVKEFER
jgi:3-oxoacyl-[acyl-carrier-protein] synthase II